MNIPNGLMVVEINGKQWLRKIAGIQIDREHEYRSTGAGENAKFYLTPTIRYSRKVPELNGGERIIERIGTEIPLIINDRRIDEPEYADCYDIAMRIGH